MKRFLLAMLLVTLLSAASIPEYAIQAILLANSPGDSVADFIMVNARPPALSSDIGDTNDLGATLSRAVA